MSSPSFRVAIPGGRRRRPPVRRAPHATRTALATIVTVVTCTLLAACGAGADGVHQADMQQGDMQQADMQRGGVLHAADAGSPRIVTDDGGRVHRLERPATRIISLIPSANETLVAIGAADRLVGRTRYDVAPEVVVLPSVGGGIDPSIETIIALRPDVVIGWENEKRRGVAGRLEALGIPFLSLRTQDTTDMFRGIAMLGALTGAESGAEALAARLRAEFDDVRRSVARMPRPAVMYIVFHDPASTAGRDTFISQVIGVAGGRPIFEDVDQLWPTVSLEEVVRRDPDVVVLPVDDTSAAAAASAVRELRGRAGWRDVRAVREGHVATVPTNLTSRPGPHLGTAARVLRDAIHNPTWTTR